MKQDDIIRMAREAGAMFNHIAWVERDLAPIFERFAAMVEAAERNKLAAWMIERGYATGHGDTTEDLLQELEWQIAENWTNALVKGIEGERKFVLDFLQKQADIAADDIDRQWALEMRDVVAARSNT